MYGTQIKPKKNGIECRNRLKRQRYEKITLTRFHLLHEALASAPERPQWPITQTVLEQMNQDNIGPYLFHLHTELFIAFVYRRITSIYDGRRIYGRPAF